MSDSPGIPSAAGCWWLGGLVRGWAVVCSSCPPRGPAVSQGLGAVAGKVGGGAHPQ